MPSVKLPPGVPEFDTWLKQQQSRNGKKEERKGGVPWMPNFAGARGAGFGAHLTAALGSKVGLLALFGLIGSAAAGVGVVNRNRLLQEQAAAKRRQFDTQLVRDHMLRQHEALQKSVPTKDGVRSDTLGFVRQGDLGSAANGAGGPTPDAPATAQDASAEGKKAGDGEAAPAASDPNALAAAMMAQAQAGAPPASGGPAGSGRGIGQLSAGLSGLSGGGGMSGGIGRGFDAPKFGASPLGKGEAFKGGLGEQALLNSRVARGSQRKWLSNRNVTARARSGATAKRLQQLNSLVSPNKTGEGTKIAAANTAAWDAIEAPGKAITGPGASAPAAAVTAAPTVAPGPAPGEGGPIDMNNGAFGSGTPSVPDIPEYQNVTPYQKAIDFAKFLMVMITAISVVIMILKLTGWGAALIPWLTYAVAGMGATLMALGVYMMSFGGQALQGLIWTGIGAVVAVAALISPTATHLGAINIGKGLSVQAITQLSATGAAGTAGYVKGSDFITQDAQKEDYKKQYGVDPDTGEVLNPEKFDRKHGPGASKQWNANADLRDMR